MPEPSAAPIVSTSNSGPTVSNTESRLRDQREILERLAEGEEIATQEWNGVLKKCYVCDKWMLEAFFQAHGLDCWHDEESEPDKWGY